MKQLVAVPLLVICYGAFADISPALETAIREFTDSDVVAHIELESIEVVNVSETHTVFRIEARILEAFRGDHDSSTLCFRTMRENPVERFPQPGDRQVVGLVSIPEDLTCYGFDTAGAIPSDDKFIVLMRALRDTNELE